jgi:NAD(P)-dependent dehydrogenase (short-subunit alcohol dehydrogenase family)
VEHHQGSGAADDPGGQRRIDHHDQLGGRHQGRPRLRPLLRQDHPNYIHSFSPGALPTDSLAAPDLISDIVVWLASDASSLVTAAQIPADKGYLKI